MRSLLFAGLASALVMMPQAASAAADSDILQPEIQAPVDVSFASAAAIAASVDGAKSRMPQMGKRMGGNMGHMKSGSHRVKMGGNSGRWGNKTNGRWNGGMRAPGGYNGYTHPRRGYRLPSYWVQPSFFVGNYSTYGFSQPTAGYGWSRYYDDAVLTDRRGVIYDSVQNVDWDRYEQGYNQGYQTGYNQGQASYDNRVLMSDTRVVAPGAPSYAGGTTYQGDWDGEYRADGSYEGDWQGTYRDADGRVYEGEYSGTFIGDGNSAPLNDGVSYADSGSHWGYEGNQQQGYVRGDYDRNDELAYLAQCRKSSGIGGAVVGGAIGALAGNRIAGRGNRLGGSLIGGGVGAVAGAAIEQGTDRCRKLLKKYGERPQYRAQAQPQYQPQYAPAPQYRAPAQPQYQPRYQQAYPSGWQGGYAQQGYYYPQAQPMVTTITVQPSVATTTTTTTYIDEEVTYAAPRAKSKKLYKPAAKRVWKPKRAPEPLKGCQQAHC